MPRECYTDPETEIPAGRWHATLPEYVSSPQERWAACLKLVQAWIAE